MSGFFYFDNSGNVSSMAEMKETINALGEYQEMKSQVIFIILTIVFNL